MTAIYTLLVNLAAFAALIGVPFMIAIVCGIYFSVRRMQAAPELQPAPESMSALSAELSAEVAAFLAAQNFRPDNSWRFHQIELAIWTQPGGPPLQRFYFSRVMGKTMFEFISVFSEDASLTTTKTRSAFLFPRYFGSFLQAFPSATIAQLWEAHVRGTQFLASNPSIQVRESSSPFAERFRHGILMQLAVIRALPFWQVRSIYWFSVKRFLRHNRPIWEQNLARMYPPAPPLTGFSS